MGTPIRDLMKEYPTDKRKAILDAALALFTKRGFHGTPTSLIAQEAGVATGTLFHYFKTKEELIESLYLDIKKDAGAVLRDASESESGQRANREKLEDVCMAFATWGLENPQKIHFMQQFCYSPFISKEAQEEGVSNFLFLIDRIALGIKEGTIRDRPPELILSLVSSGLMAAILAAAREKDPQKQHYILKHAIDIILHGVLFE
jgi:AcrR family transcriptional regulator